MKMQCGTVDQAHECSSSSSDDAIVDVEGAQENIREDFEVFDQHFYKSELIKGKMMGLEYLLLRELKDQVRMSEFLEHGILGGLKRFVVYMEKARLFQNFAYFSFILMMLLFMIYHFLDLECCCQLT